MGRVRKTALEADRAAFEKLKGDLISDAVEKIFLQISDEKEKFFCRADVKAFVNRECQNAFNSIFANPEFNFAYKCRHSLKERIQTILKNPNVQKDGAAAYRVMLECYLEHADELASIFEILDLMFVGVIKMRILDSVDGGVFYLTSKIFDDGESGVGNILFDDKIVEKKIKELRLILTEAKARVDAEFLRLEKQNSSLQSK